MVTQNATLTLGTRENPGTAVTDVNENNYYRKLCLCCHTVHCILTSSLRAIAFQQIAHTPLHCKHLHSVASLSRSWSFRKCLACRWLHTIPIVLDWISGSRYICLYIYLYIYIARERERDRTSIPVHVNAMVYSLLASNGCWVEGVCEQAAQFVASLWLLDRQSIRSCRFNNPSKYHRWTLYDHTSGTLSQ